VEHTPIVQTVCEADIDWIICLELNTCSEFATWFCAQVFGSEVACSRSEAWRSVKTATGESDLLWRVTDESRCRHLALVENKINAAAQPEQYERYCERAREYEETDVCERAAVVLLAPAQYHSADSDSYGKRIAYESIRDWLGSRPDARSRYLTDLFQLAIEKLGARAEPCPEVSAFRRSIWEMGRREFPELNISEPGEVGPSQYWISMPFEGFKLIYKMYKSACRWGDCVVDLELPGRAQDVPQLRERYQHVLAGAGIEVVPTGKSASFRRLVPKVEPPAFVEDPVRAALRAASELLTWWQQANVRDSVHP
jgi:hypothetical protein